MILLQIASYWEFILISYENSIFAHTISSSKLYIPSYFSFFVCVYWEWNFLSLSVIQMVFLSQINFSPYSNFFVKTNRFLPLFPLNIIRRNGFFLPVCIYEKYNYNWEDSYFFTFFNWHNSSCSYYLHLHLLVHVRHLRLFLLYIL